MEDFTNGEISALSQFRKRVADILPDEFSKRNENLIRWIRARDHNLDKSEEMIRTSVKWRINNKVDRVLLEVIDEYMEQAFPYWLDGHDRQGRVVWTVPFGSWDVRKSIEEDGPERFTRFMTAVLEKLTKRLREVVEEGEEDSSPRAMRCVLVTSMNGFSYRQLANMKSVQTLLQQVSVMESHYPETLEIVYGVDAPAVFSILFNLMKPLLSPRTLGKVNIMGCNRKEWEPIVHELISPDQIREPFGGTKV